MVQGGPPLDVNVTTCAQLAMRTAVLVVPACMQQGCLWPGFEHFAFGLRPKRLQLTNKNHAHTRSSQRQPSHSSPPTWRHVLHVTQPQTQPHHPPGTTVL
jgi:hypothetical protein